MAAEHATFALTTADIVNLKQAGASDELIRAMIKGSPAAGPDQDWTQQYYQGTGPAVSAEIYYDPFGYYWCGWPYYYAYFDPFDWTAPGFYYAGWWNTGWFENGPWGRFYWDRYGTRSWPWLPRGYRSAPHDWLARGGAWGRGAGAFRQVSAPGYGRASYPYSVWSSSRAHPGFRGVVNVGRPIGNSGAYGRGGGYQTPSGPPAARGTGRSGGGGWSSGGGRGGHEGSGGRGHGGWGR